MWIKRWKWCDGFSTGITLPISRIEKGKSKRWPVEQNVVVGLSIKHRIRQASLLPANTKPSEFIETF